MVARSEFSTPSIIQVCADFKPGILVCADCTVFSRVCTTFAVKRSIAAMLSSIEKTTFNKLNCGNTGNKNVQLVSQHYCDTSRKVVLTLRVLHPTHNLSRNKKKCVAIASCYSVLPKVEVRSTFCSNLQHIFRSARQVWREM